MHKIRILLAEDMTHEQMVIRAKLEDALKGQAEIQFTIIDSAEDAIEQVKRSKFDLAILDIDFSKSAKSRGMDGLTASRKIKAINPEIYNVMVSSNDHELVMTSAVNEYSADWYLRRSSIAYEELASLSKQALLSRLHREGLLIEEKNRFHTANFAARQVLRKVDSILPHQGTLIYGETGTGKELIARRIHANAKVFDQRRPLKILDCSSLSANLFEGEVFGHKKGSFTGAVSDRVGALKLADGGDLFLDEIHNIPIGLQQKLLRVLNDGVFSPVGSNEEIKSNFRIIAATNIPISESIAAGKLLPDFVARICKIKIDLIPLRERPEDIVTLTASYLENLGNIDKEFSLDALECMKGLPWQGNIRELHSFIDTMVSTVKIPIISKTDISNLNISNDSAKEPTIPRSQFDNLVGQILEQPIQLAKLIEDIEKAYLLKASSEKDSLSNLSASSGYSKTTLSRRLKFLGLTLSK